MSVGNVTRARDRRSWSSRCCSAPRSPRLGSAVAEKSRANNAADAAGAGRGRRASRSGDSPARRVPTARRTAADNGARLLTCRCATAAGRRRGRRARAMREPRSMRSKREARGRRGRTRVGASATSRCAAHNDHTVHSGDFRHFRLVGHTFRSRGRERGPISAPMLGTEAERRPKDATMSMKKKLFAAAAAAALSVRSAWARPPLTSTATTARPASPSTPVSVPASTPPSPVASAFPTVGNFNDVTMNGTPQLTSAVDRTVHGDRRLGFRCGLARHAADPRLHRRRVATSSSATGAQMNAPVVAGAVTPTRRWVVSGRTPTATSRRRRRSSTPTRPTRRTTAVPRSVPTA